MIRRHVIVMVKEPRPGRVKTRLARDIGSVAAAAWYRRETASLLRRLRDPRWQLVVAVTPDAEGLASRVWPRDLPRLPQGQGDLGKRMARLLRSLPGGLGVVVGSDVPELERRHIAKAFAALGHASSVIGPSEDGGYWLVGLKHAASAPPDLFKGVRWSGPHARSDTQLTLPRPLAEIDLLRDVDDAGDLAYLRRRRMS